MSWFLHNRVKIEQLDIHFFSTCTFFIVYYYLRINSQTSETGLFQLFAVSGSNWTTTSYTITLRKGTADRLVFSLLFYHSIIFIYFYLITEFRLFYYFSFQSIRSHSSYLQNVYIQQIRGISSTYDALKKMHLKINELSFPYKQVNQGYSLQTNSETASGCR